MRCSCLVCGTYMVHSESIELGCVCPECNNRCKACLGTNSVISRDALKNLKDNPMLMDEILTRLEDPTGPDPHDIPDDQGRPDDRHY